MQALEVAVNRLSSSLWFVESSQPGIESMSPALAGGFSRTIPPRKSYTIFIGSFPFTVITNYCYIPCAVHTSLSLFYT